MVAQRAKRAERAEIDRFRELVRQMTPQSEVFKMLQEELRLQKRWRNLPRGKPRHGSLGAE